MNKKILGFILISAVVVSSMPKTTFAENGIKFYVYPGGSDITGNGSFYRPYKTVEKATEKVKEVIKSGTKKDIEVILRKGEYTLAKPISYDYFSKKDYNGKITYKAYGNENVTFLGARKSSEWEAYQNGIYKVSCPNKVNVVFENGNNAIKARFPNRGKKRSDGFLTAAANGTDRILYFNENDFPKVMNMADLQCYLFPGQNYALDNPRVSVNYENNSLNLESYTTNHSEILKGSRYYMQNALEFLDEPGEMYYNSIEKCLYYMPYNGNDINNVYIPNLTTAISISGHSTAKISNFEFSGIEFKYFGANVSDAGYIAGVSYADSVNFNNCFFNTSGAGAVSFRGSDNNEFIGNKIKNIGGTAIQINGYEINSGNNIIKDNYIDNIGYYEAESNGITVNNSSNNQIVHNRISNTPRSAISFGSGTCQVWAMLKKETIIDGVKITRDNIKPYLYTNDNLIAYNDCSNAMLETDDGGVIYAWGAGYDNKILNNYIHDSTQEFSFGWILYMDDDVSHTLLRGNYIKNCNSTDDGQLVDIVIVKGQENVCENNLFVNCEYKNAMARVDSQSGAGPVGNAVFRKNIFYNCGDTMFSFYSYTIGDTSENNRLKECNNNVYFDKNADDYGIKIRNSQNEYNVTATKAEWQEKYERDIESSFSLPGFYDCYTGDYRLDETKSKYEIESIDFVNAGITDNYKYIKGEEVKTLNVKAKNSNNPDLCLSRGESIDLEIAARDEYGIPAHGTKIEVVSSNEAVCKAFPNKLTAESAGSATITVIAKHGKKAISAELYVTVE